MRELAGRAWFAASLVLGRALRGARYASVRLVSVAGTRQVRKTRALHAPLLIALGGPLMRMLGTGVRVLPQRAWEARERDLFARLYGAPVTVEADGTLVLPWLPGETLATLLEDAALDEPARARAVHLAAVALAALHRDGITHGDAMADNVMVDPDAGTARWFDFETEHDARRPLAWRRADDLRALLATCVARTARTRRAETMDRVLDAYADDEVARALAAHFTVAARRLPFHLGQARLSARAYRDVVRMLAARARG